MNVGPTDMKHEMECQHRLRWMLYSSFAAFFIFIAVSEISLFTTVKNALVSPLYSHHDKYVIVFDGGSTGTRIHVFKFFNSTDGFVMLQDEYFQETKPGLSSYADLPKKAALSIENLLEKAKSFIPSERWQETQVSVKATAGLRLLPTYKSNIILEEVFSVIKNSPFHCEEDCVGVLDGEDEGVFAWFTLNFLLGHIDYSMQSAALLDLGGGSTQVTFAPSEISTFASSPSGFIINRRVHGRTLTIYSHSYLGLGLMSARFAILKLTKGYEDNMISDDKNLESPCLLPDVKVDWKHNLKKYSVSGLRSGVHSFEECYARATEFLNSTMHKPTELWKREVFAVSYYFERGAELGVVGGNGGTVTIQQLWDAAIKECSSKVPTKPFLCLDASYIIALLHHGLGFGMQKEISLVQQIKGIETSWGLGAAFSLLK